MTLEDAESHVTAAIDALDDLDRQTPATGLALVLLTSARILIHSRQSSSGDENTPEE